MGRNNDSDHIKEVALLSCFKQKKFETIYGFAFFIYGTVKKPHMNLNSKSSTYPSNKSDVIKPRTIIISKQKQKDIKLLIVPRILINEHLDEKKTLKQNGHLFLQRKTKIFVFFFSVSSRVKNRKNCILPLHVLLFLFIIS